MISDDKLITSFKTNCMKKYFALLIFFCPFVLFAQQPYNGIDANLSNIYRLSNAQTRSISPENFTGEKGKGGMATVGLRTEFIW